MGGGSGKRATLRMGAAIQPFRGLCFRMPDVRRTIASASRDLQAREAGVSGRHSHQ